MTRCPRHCPQDNLGAVALLIPLGALAAAGWIVFTYLWWIVAIAAVSLGATCALVWYLLRYHTMIYRRSMERPALPASERLALPARAPRAIEAPRTVIPAYVIASKAVPQSQYRQPGREHMIWPGIGE